MSFSQVYKGASEFGVGFGTGYNFALIKGKEDEVKQGGNYTMSGAIQGVQCALALNMVDQIAEQVSPLGIIGKVALNALSFLFLPAGAAIGNVRHNYDGFKGLWNKFLPSPIHLPEKLSPGVAVVINFLSDHLGHIAQVAIIVGSVALIILGKPIVGAACLLAIGYQAIDNYGFVPRKISLFMETYLPIIAQVGLSIGGPILMKVAALLSLPTYIFPSVSHFIQHQIDRLAHKIFSFKAPLLQDTEAPLLEKRNLNYDQIKKVLENDKDYQINPAHYTKWVVDQSALPVSEDYDQLVILFQSVPWERHYSLVKKKLVDDDRFKEMLKKKIPGTTSLEEEMDNILTTLGNCENPTLTKEQFASKWTNQQMNELVKILKGEKRVKGSQRDLEDAMKSIQVIIPYLNNLNKEIDKLQNIDPSPLQATDCQALHNKSFELQDMLLKLAIEGGDYCARGIKRASGEIVSTIMQSQIMVEGHVNATPEVMFELNIRQKLQEQRLRIVEGFYKMISAAFPKKLTDDVHTFDIYRTALTLGFYPLTTYERNNVDISQLYLREYMLGLTQMVGQFGFYESYDPEEAFEGEQLKFGEYIRKMIGENPLLDAAQKESIMDIFTKDSEDPQYSAWTTKEILKKFHRLMFYTLGIVREKVKK